MLGTQALAGEVLENTFALVPFHVGGKFIPVFFMCVPFLCNGSQQFRLPVYHSDFVLRGFPHEIFHTHVFLNVCCVCGSFFNCFCVHPLCVMSSK